MNGILAGSVKTASSITSHGHGEISQEVYCKRLVLQKMSSEAIIMICYSSHELAHAQTNTYIIMHVSLVNRRLVHSPFFQWRYFFISCSMYICIRLMFYSEVTLVITNIGPAIGMFSNHILQFQIKLDKLFQFHSLEVVSAEEHISTSSIWGTHSCRTKLFN